MQKTKILKNVSDVMEKAISDAMDEHCAPLHKQIADLKDKLDAAQHSTALVVHDQGEDLLRSMATIGRTLDKLPRNLRGIIVSREIHMLTYRQISEIYKIPVGTVMSRLHRARMLFRQASSPVRGKKGKGSKR